MSCDGGEPLEHVGAERRGRGDADAHSTEDDARPQRRERFLAVLVVGAVDDQHAVEMVELVLRRRARRSRRARAARPRRARSLPSSTMRVARSTGTRTPCSERQPSSSGSQLVAALDDRGLTIAARPLVVGLEHEEAAQHADLRRCEPDALRVVHQRRSSARRAGAGRRRSPSTSCAFRRSAGSPYWRICASASRRRTSPRPPPRASSSSSCSCSWPCSCSWSCSCSCVVFVRPQAAQCSYLSGETVEDPVPRRAARADRAAADLDEVARARVHRAVAPRSGTSGCAARSGR